MAQDFKPGIYGLANPFDTPERRAFREIIEAFVQIEIRPHAHAWDEAGYVPWELHEKIGALGVFGFGIDEKYGGLGFDDPFYADGFRRGHVDVRRRRDPCCHRRARDIFRPATKAGA